MSSTEAQKQAQRRYRLRHPDRVKAGDRRRYLAKRSELLPERALAKRQRRQWLHDYKLARGCADCGYRAHAEALEFDHRDPASKLGNVANMIQCSWQRTLTELEKCDVVCANCHRIRTAERRVR